MTTMTSLQITIFEARPGKVFFFSGLGFKEYFGWLKLGWNQGLGCGVLPKATSHMLLVARVSDFFGVSRVACYYIVII
ncbi:MAG: hypothetical protein ACHQQQ_05885 [Bacteroidota bacterium]